MRNYIIAEKNNAFSMYLNIYTSIPGAKFNIGIYLISFDHLEGETCQLKRKFIICQDTVK